METYTVALAQEQVLALIAARAETESPAHLAGVYLDGPKKLIYRPMEGGVHLRLKPGHWGERGKSGGRLRVEMYEVNTGTAVHATFEEDQRLPARNNLSVAVTAFLLLAFVCALSDALSNGTFQPSLLIWPVALMLMLAGQFALTRAIRKAGVEDEKVLQNALAEILNPHLV